MILDEFRPPLYSGEKKKFQKIYNRIQSNTTWMSVRQYCKKNICVYFNAYIYIYIEVNIYPSNFSFFLSIVVVTLNSKSRRMVTFSIRFCGYGSDTYPMEHKGIITLSKREWRNSIKNLFAILVLFPCYYYDKWSASV